MRNFIFFVLVILFYASVQMYIQTDEFKYEACAALIFILGLFTYKPEEKEPNNN